mmetsp:Transcript_45819/g.108012  ORF Transcript_45819/g.108012 Transcript_45819/m.108012 type:complete len:321 (-) Transcript_45819:90-1052(-)
MSRTCFSIASRSTRSPFSTVYANIPSCARADTHPAWTSASAAPSNIPFRPSSTTRAHTHATRCADTTAVHRRRPPFSPAGFSFAPPFVGVLRGVGGTSLRTSDSASAWSSSMRSLTALTILALPPALPSLSSASSFAITASSRRLPSLTALAMTSTPAAMTSTPPAPSAPAPSVPSMFPSLSLVGVLGCPTNTCARHAEMSTGRSAAGTGTSARALLEADARRCAAVASARSRVMGDADVGIAATEEESATARKDPSSAAAVCSTVWVAKSEEPSSCASHCSSTRPCSVPYTESMATSALHGPRFPAATPPACWRPTSTR